MAQDSPNYTLHEVDHRWCGICFTWRPITGELRCASCGSELLRGSRVPLKTAWDPETGVWFGKDVV